MALTSVVSDMGALIASLGYGTVGADLFEGFMPKSPVNAIALYEGKGRDPVRTSAKTVAAERPKLSVIVRNSDYETGCLKAAQIKKSLQGFNGTINGATYLDVTAQGTVNSLGKGEDGGFRFSVNFWLMKVPQ